MRSLLVVLALVAACRTGGVDAPDLRPADLSATVDAGRDLASVELGDVCRPDNPDGSCAPGTTCCPYSCWGGNDETGWCFTGAGCPVC
jgi:hypothetical protein